MGRTGLVPEAVKFGLVGLANVVVDVALFNVLRSPLGPPAAKAVSTGVAIVSSYLMNRYWTWRDRVRTPMGRQFVLFVVLSGVGLLIAEVCLVVSHYVLGFDSRLADNVSANVIGLGAAMLFRFWSYRRWVFLRPPAEPPVTATTRHVGSSGDAAARSSSAGDRRVPGNWRGDRP